MAHSLLFITATNFENKKMKINMGFTDRFIRVLLALLFVILYLTGTVTGIWGIVLMAVAVIFIVTSVMSFCPIYFHLG